MKKIATQDYRDAMIWVVVPRRGLTRGKAKPLYPIVPAMM
jgi:hypothetical protein